MDTKLAVASFCAGYLVCGAFTLWTLGLMDKELKKKEVLLDLYKEFAVDMASYVPEEDLRKALTDMKFSWITHDINIKEK